MLHADDGAGHGVGIVAVYTAELDGSSIQEYLHPIYFDLPDAHSVGDDLVLALDEHGVEIGLLGIPQGGLGNVQDSLMGIVADMLLRGHFGGVDQTILSVQQPNDSGNTLTGEGEANADSSFILFLLGGHEVVPHMVLRTLDDVYIPEDAAGAELVLILQVAAIAPLQHQNGQSIFALTDLISHIKLAGGVGDLVVTHILAVEPDIQAGIHTLKVQVSLGCLFVLSIGKGSQVSAAGIILGNEGRICREGVMNIGVLVLIAAMILPDAGNGDGVVGGGIETFLIEQLSQVMDTGVVAELPVAV